MIDSTPGGAAQCAATSCSCHPLPDPRLKRQALVLQYVTIAYNAVEAVVSLALGVAASALSLIAFGADSAIELSASLIMIWRLTARLERFGHERAERLAGRAIGVCFFALAASVAFEAIRDLAGGEEPEKTMGGIVIAALSAVIMPLLARTKKRLAVKMGMGSMASEAAQTSICGWLSLILLVSLLVHHVFGFAWIDAAASLCMLPIIVREGLESWRGRACACGA